MCIRAYFPSKIRVLGVFMQGTVVIYSETSNGRLYRSRSKHINTPTYIVRACCRIARMTMASLAPILSWAFLFCHLCTVLRFHIQSSQLPHLDCKIDLSSFHIWKCFMTALVNLAFMFTYWPASPLFAIMLPTIYKRSSADLV